MKYIEVVADTASLRTIAGIADKVKAVDFRPGHDPENGMRTMRLLVDNEQLQPALDALQNVLGAQPSARVVVIAVEAALPKPAEEDSRRKRPQTAAREALYEEVARSARADKNYVVLVILSTLVAAIGLLTNNVAVVIGAMVIAPLLGPNLALSLGAALGDVSLIARSAWALVLGVSLSIGFSAGLGWIYLPDIASPELVARTVVGVDSVALALASGAAAALSLTTGLSSVLVGVMVAVALLPPAATLGIMLGQGQWSLALGAGLLLAVNIVSVNLASKVVFALKGISPRTWLEKEKARRVMWTYVLGWLVAIVLLLVIIYARHSLVE